MFWGKKPQKANIDPDLGFDFSPWLTQYYTDNAHSIADFCRARGRYELALKFRKIDMEYYRDNIVNQSDPFLASRTTPEMQEKFEEHLLSRQSDFEYLKESLKARNEILELLKSASNGLTRQELEERISLTSDIKWGVFLNQLARGEWVTQQGEKKAARIRFTFPPCSDQEFLTQHYPPR